MKIEEVKEKLIQLIPNLFKDNGFEVKDIETCDLVEDLGMDSLIFMTLIVELEEVFELNIPDELLLVENFNRFDKILHIIATVVGNQISEN